ncbi:response regulator [Blastopirellula sp. J2-11]|uniref:response regulator n=1 Tax=Blastopirellula sp. J2-11 TaxID=2943192 RepID=UPI0021CA30EA|nr:response regulator [Blastopirellula sp. J2-11]UUO05974.1 response regulator [Blastopirellula sp. J2-11]
MNVNEQRILHIDDDPTITRMMQARLAQHGYAVDELHDPTCWRGALVNGGYRVVILDIEMPQLSGLEVLQQIKQFDIGVAVIMLTGQLKMNLVFEALGYGAEYCLFKPADELRPILEALEASFYRIDHWRSAGAHAARQMRIQKKTSEIKSKLKASAATSSSIVGQLPASFEWRRFEDYLVLRGALTPEKLEIARAAYARSVKPIGQIALQNRYLGVAGLMQVLERQADTQALFGETAIELKLLTPEQVEDLLEKQQHLSTTPQDAIFTVGAMTPVNLNRYLAEYLREMEASSSWAVPSPETTDHHHQVTATL